MKEHKNQISVGLDQSDPENPKWIVQRDKDWVLDPGPYGRSGWLITEKLGEFAKLEDALVLGEQEAEGRNIPLMVYN